MRFPFTCAALVPLFLAIPSTAANPVDPARAHEILAEIHAKGDAHFESYQGVRSRQVSLSKEIDPDTGKVLRELKSTTRQENYYTRRPSIKVLSCMENGKPAKLETCKTKPPEPLFPVLGPGSRSNYDLRLAGKQKVRGEDCWKIIVQPRKETKRHFKGSIYFSVKGLRFMAMRGRPADLRFGVKSMWMSIRFKSLKNVPVVTGGLVRVRVKVPLIYNRIIKVSFTEYGHRLIKR